MASIQTNTGITPRVSRAITQQSEEGLRNIIANYDKRGAISGAVYSRQEVVLEVFRRKCLPYDGFKVVSVILGLAQASQDGFVSYKGLWNALAPKQGEWGQHSVKECMKAMGAAIHFCVVAKLPIVTSLVVSGCSRELSAKAAGNILCTALMLGVETQLTPEDFVLAQALGSLDLVAQNLEV